MAKAVVQTSFSERVNVKKAIALMNLPSREIKALFWDKDEINKMNGGKWSYSAYTLCLHPEREAVLEAGDRFRWGHRQNVQIREAGGQRATLCRELWHPIVTASAEELPLR